MKTTIVLALAALACGALMACAFHPSGEERADLTTGSHIPKKYPPGSIPNDGVKVVKPSPGDNAAGEATAQPMGSRPN